ncbi:hypothetical protein GTA08_BOTSDO06593 [Botryosphaeria dothidea]|uniref:Uncharacterized protein n=1 Tax=Botryosphaeria dothidea TaxID=55169 RepID=A0A8H4IQ18_9PEZI|nr:hypothetical protein GTA08_BOTSDO06593 [Botryosphaeria dothidea]
MPVGEIWNLKTQEDILERTCRASQLGRYAAEIMWLPAGCRAVVSPSRLPCLSLRLCLRLFLRLARLVPLSPPPPPPALPTAHKPLSAGASLPHDEHRNPPPQPLPQALARQSSRLSPAAPSAAQAPAPHRTGHRFSGPRAAPQSTTNLPAAQPPPTASRALWVVCGCSRQLPGCRKRLSSRRRPGVRARPTAHGHFGEAALSPEFAGQPRV